LGTGRAPGDWLMGEDSAAKKEELPQSSQRRGPVGHVGIDIGTRL